MARLEATIDVSSADFRTSRAAIVDAFMQVAKDHPHLASADLYSAGMIVMGQLAAVLGVDPAGKATYELFRLGYDATNESRAQPS